VTLVESLFQQRVYAVVAAIPKGSTMTYGQVAQELRKEGIKASAQAVGQALKRNPWPVDRPRPDGFFIPCHRVVASNGIGGFAGEQNGPEIVRKRRLLQDDQP
jgi:methylated-DNA-[protein]-cysteine S-methyltransferase